MSEPMKKSRTETITIRGVNIPVPPEKAKAVLILLQDELRAAKDDDGELVLASESPALRALDAKYTKAGTLIRGARAKEGMSQVGLAKKLGIPPSNLSEMEHGKRPIGKKMAKRLSKILNIGYQVFL